MLTKIIQSIISKKTEIKQKKYELSTLLKKDQHYAALLEDLKADKEVLKSFKEKIIQDNTDLQFRYTSIEAIKSELKMLNEELVKKIVPAVQDDNGQLKLFGELELNITVK